MLGKLEAALPRRSLGWQSRGLPSVPPRLLYVNDSCWDRVPPGNLDEFLPHLPIGLSPAFQRMNFEMGWGRGWYSSLTLWF